MDFPLSLLSPPLSLLSPPSRLIDDLAAASLHHLTCSRTPTPPPPKTQRKLEAECRCFQWTLFLFFPYPPPSPPPSIGVNVIQARDGEAGGVNEILIGAARPCLHLVLRAELPTLPFCLEQELLQEAEPVITGQGGGEGGGGWISSEELIYHPGYLHPPSDCPSGPRLSSLTPNSTPLTSINHR